ncbi:YaiI/YqxD family protein [Kangiella sp. HZ709]|uniref:YaiI/YqxD family protein n=1 Tax=Kangiella sp. HZ709 TaxID=2666328 RepID=UPI0012B0DCD6|nr:YaiI/YqxD family protein [Kangiella sp. HZ709]MRX26549.1 YaiI/YqxD family protein [Kangiella sp. HZ709]
MQIFVDADACPVVIRDILIKAAIRTKVSLTFIANHYVPVPKIENIKSLQVPKGFDVADDEIVKRVEANDLVITSDIPLAAEAIDKGAIALSARGELFDKSNIRQRLNMRDFMDSMRETLEASGQNRGGPPPLSQSDRQSFANHLDKYLASIR